jgi:hypothetical protein
MSHRKLNYWGESSIICFTQESHRHNKVLCNNNLLKFKFKCFNRVHPISHTRLWELQILIISIPLLIFTAVTLGVQEKSVKLNEEVKLYEENPASDYTSMHYAKQKLELQKYSIIKVNIVSIGGPS